jgi:hypothetical protein
MDATAEASWAVSRGDNWDAERPNRTCEKISSVGRGGVEVRVISGLAAVPRMRTIAVKAGSARTAARSRRIRAGSSER